MFNTNTYNRLLCSDKLGRKLVVLEEVDSTNSWISRRLDDPDIDRIVAVAERQTAGRGRFGRVWVSPPGVNLAFSLAWQVPESLRAVSVITLAAGVALAEAVLDATGAEPKLKYPNDLILGGRKMAGILTEFKRVQTGSFTIIGVGVNVNTKAESFPEEIKKLATSILLATGKSASREAVLAIFLNMLERWIAKLITEGVEPVVERFKELSLPFVGKAVAVTGAGEPIRGVAVGLSADGGLMIEISPGVVKTVASGETVFEDE